MKNWIIGTIIAGAICLYIGSLATKEVKKVATQNQQTVNAYVNSVNELIERELGQ
jgi:precorrin-4 methylase